MGNTRRLSDAWYSTDGAHWTEAVDSSPWVPRDGLASVSFNGLLWILGGATDAGSKNDVWYSTGLGISEEGHSPGKSPQFITAGPNPFRGLFRLTYHLVSSSRVKAVVRDCSGTEVRVLALGRQEPGSHSVSWDGTDSRERSVPAGIYFVRVSVDNNSGALKLVKLQ